MPSDDLYNLLLPSRLTSVVDVGANPLGDAPPYQAMLQNGVCRVTGFDPHPSALPQLEAEKGSNEIYLPYAVGDGTPHVLNICRGMGFASLLQPDEKTLSHFPTFSELGRVIDRITLQTRRLDDIVEITDIDLLKIDIQGSELSVIRNGAIRLAKAVAVQTEVSFIPLYRDQPVFGDIDLALRKLGFVPHMFAAINKKMIAPMIAPNVEDAFNQIVEADVVYVRNFIDADAMQPEQLKHLAMIAHHCYGSFDLALNCIHHLVRHRAIAPNSAARYLALVQSAKPA
jgi:FkbM family methyltransferase